MHFYTFKYILMHTTSTRCTYVGMYACMYVRVRVRAGAGAGAGARAGAGAGAGAGV